MADRTGTCDFGNWTWRRLTWREQREITEQVRRLVRKIGERDG